MKTKTLLNTICPAKNETFYINTYTKAKKYHTTKSAFFAIKKIPH